MNERKKKELLTELLADGQVLIHIDSRGRYGMGLPIDLENTAPLPLNLNYKFPNMNLEMDDEGLSAQLSFQGKPHQLSIPWKAVFGISTGPRTWMFMPDVPWDLPEFAEMVIEVSTLVPVLNEHAKSNKLRSIKGGKN